MGSKPCLTGSKSIRPIGTTRTSPGGAAQSTMSLMSAALAQPPAVDSRPNWVSRLDSALAAQIVEVVDAFWAGQLSEQFPSVSHLGRWLIEKVPRPVTLGTVSRFINSRKPNG